MFITVQGHKTYCYTGGKPFDATKPTAVFIHGVLNDHSVWILQTRWFANHGWNVLAVDLPGHCPARARRLRRWRTRPSSSWPCLTRRVCSAQR